MFKSFKFLYGYRILFLFSVQLFRLCLPFFVLSCCFLGFHFPFILFHLNSNLAFDRSSTELSSHIAMEKFEEMDALSKDIDFSVVGGV